MKKLAREGRKLSSTGFYHVIIRGINRQHLFEEENDYNYFLESIENLKREMRFEVHAYCLMSNHVHILLREKEIGDISQIMKRLLTKYAMYFNRKYERKGALIGSRYKSIPVEVDEYFIPLIRYIHQNPHKAGQVKNFADYRYSSYQEYIGRGRLTTTDFSLDMVGREEWTRLHNILEEQNFEIVGKKMSEEKIRREILECVGGRDPYEIGSIPKLERNEIIRQLKEEGLSIRQIERATGISRGIVAKC